MAGLKQGAAGLPRRGPRSAQVTPKNARQTTGVLKRVIERFQQDARKEFAAQQRKELNRHRFSSRADVERRARVDQAAGKIPRGQLQRTIERRWKAARTRREKFTGKQAADRAAFEANLKQQVDAIKQNPGTAGVQLVTASVEWQDSSELREAVLSFPSTPETLQADARDALRAYRAGGSVELGSVTALNWEPL